MQPPAITPVGELQQTMLDWAFELVKSNLAEMYALGNAGTTQREI